MADKFNIYKHCTFCGGDGLENKKLPNGSGEDNESCHECNGEGKKLWGEMLEQEEE